MKPRDTGILAEKIASSFLRSKGYKIIQTNYKAYIGEIDIVAINDDELVFIEVRGKTGQRFSSPQESIDKNKKYKLAALAQVYLQQNHNLPENYRIDIVGITFNDSGSVDNIEHIINAIESYDQF